MGSEPTPDSPDNQEQRRCWAESFNVSHGGRRPARTSIASDLGAGVAERWRAERERTEDDDCGEVRF